MVASPVLSENQRPILILVEEDDGVRRSLQLLLLGCGYLVRSFASAVSALADPSAITAECLVVGYFQSGGGGLNLLHTLRSRGWSGRAVLLTAVWSAAVEKATRGAGFDAVVEKPVRHQDILAALTPRSPRRAGGQDIAPE